MNTLSLLFRVVCLLALLFTFSIGTSQEISKAKAVQVNNDSEASFYKVNSPDKTFEMPEQLKEISGLTISPDKEHLFAVNDEEGIIFFINKKTGGVVRKVKFHKNGDYEGIECVGDDVYVVKSSGTVYQVNFITADSTSFKKRKYLFRKENDTEGLGYDSKNQRLLFACKGMACLHVGCRIDGCRSKKSIYGLDLKENKLVEEPIFEIKMEEVVAFLQAHKSEEELKRFESIINPEDGDFHFHPSALAVHPLTGDVYVLASKGKKLIVLSATGKIKYVEKLKKKMHTQPEGIAFDSDGTMYISNEGKKEKPAKIHVFRAVR
ncbi:MAG: SdiA-regulated domain-containing protein [Bacteroidota bacterium]